MGDDVIVQRIKPSPQQKAPTPQAKVAQPKAQAKPSLQQGTQQQRSVALEKLSDIELLRGGGIQLQQLADLKDKKGPLYIDQRTNKPFSQKVINETRADVIIELNATIAEIEKRGLLAKNDVIGTHGDEAVLASANKELKNAVAAQDYRKAYGLVDNALDRLEASFYKKAEPAKKPGIAGMKMTQIPIGALELNGYYKTQVQPKQIKEVTCNGNDLVISSLNYASSRGWLPKKNWKDENNLKDLRTKNPDGMELVKKLMLLEATTAPDKFEALRGSIKAGNAKDAAAEIDKLLSKPKEIAPAKNAEVPGALDVYKTLDAFKQDWRVKNAAEVLGLDLAKATEDQLKDYRAADGWAVEKITAAADEKVKASTRPVVSQEFAAKCAAIEKIIGPVEQNGTVKPENSILNNQIKALVNVGLLYEEKTGREVRRDAGADDVAVFRYKGMAYALSKKYKDAAKVDDAKVKKQGKILVGKKKSDEEVKKAIRGEAITPDDAKSLLNDPVAQKVIKDKVIAGLVDLGMFDKGVLRRDNAFSDAEYAAVLQYLEDGKFNANVVSGLAKIVGKLKYDSEPNVTTVQQLVLHDKDVSDAIGAKADELAKADKAGKTKNDYANEIMGELQKNGALDKTKVLDAINGFAPGTGAPAAAQQQGSAGEGMQFRYDASGVQQGLLKRAVSALGLDEFAKVGQGASRQAQVQPLVRPDLTASVDVTQFGDVFLKEKVTLPQWFKKLEDDKGVAAAAQKLGDVKLTDYLKNQVEANINDPKYRQGTFTAAKLKAELEQQAGGAQVTQVPEKKKSEEKAETMVLAQGTWAEKYYKTGLPQEYLGLSNEDKGKVNDALVNLISSPEMAKPRKAVEAMYETEKERARIYLETAYEQATGKKIGS